MNILKKDKWHVFGLGLVVVLVTLLLLGLGILGVGSEASAVHAQAGNGIIHVATTGGDAPDCGGEAKPCRSVRHAMGQVLPAEKIRVAEGSYNGVISWSAPPGYDGPAIIASVPERLSLTGGNVVEVSGHQQGPVGTEPVLRPDGGSVMSFTVCLPIVLRDYSCSGVLSGTIVDATTGEPLPNVLVTVDGTDLSDVTGGDGNYSILGVPSGERSVTAVLAGYVTVSQDVDLRCGVNKLLNFALSPNLPPTEMRIVLTWGESPRDLDSHLWLPPETPSHIYWFNPGTFSMFPFARLDRDDTSSYGPETMTIEQSYPGTYTYAVYDWSNEADLTTSQARVHVYKGANLAATYDVPASGSGRWWHVFDIDGATQTLSARNYLTPDCPAAYDPTPGGMGR